MLYVGLGVALLALVFGLGSHGILEGVIGGAPLVRSSAGLPLETLYQMCIGQEPAGSPIRCTKFRKRGSAWNWSKCGSTAR